MTKIASGLAMGLCLSAAVLAQSTTPEARAGQILAANCANCHGTQGQAKGAMPSLAGQPKVSIVEQMKAFRDGKRAGTIMPQLAKGYSDAQIELAADYFSRQPAAR
ncbi:MAG: c-type cytochrome [Burkholderiaceae bacterium]